MNMAETVVGAGLLVLVANPAGQAEGGGVPGAGSAMLAGGELDLAEAVERVGFTGPASEFPAQGQRLAHVPDGVVEVALPQAKVADPGERIRLCVPVADLTAKGQDPVQVGGGLLVATLRKSTVPRPPTAMHTSSRAPMSAAMTRACRW